MKKRSKKTKDKISLRDKIIGLGEISVRKSYYPQLKEEIKQLEEAKEKINNIIESISDAFVSLDTDWRYTYVNKKAGEIFGRRPEDLIGKHIWTEFPEGIDQPFYKAYYKAVEEQKFVQIEEYYPPYDRWFENRIHPSKEGLSIFFTDITERKRVEEKMRLSEERFSNAFHVSPAGMTITRVADGKFIDVNESFLRMFEFSREEAIGHTSTELKMLSPQERGKLIQSQLESEGLRDFELEARSKSGRIINILFSSKPMELEGETCHITTMIDITERKKAEEALRYYKILLEETGRIAKVGGWEFDPVSLKGTWTDEVARIHDLDPEMETNVELGLSFYQSESRTKIETAVKEAIELGKPYDLELELITAKGNHKWVRTIGHPVIENGKVIKVRGSFQDVTDSKKVEEELRKYREHLEDLIKERTAELEQANIKLKEFDRLKSMFIASMSHELRTPLNSIIGFTGIILQGMVGEISKEQRDMLQRSYSSAKHLLSLISDVIDISKIETGKIEPNIEEFLLNDVVNEAISDLKTEIERKGLSLEVSIPENLKLKTDRRRLLQCILNYLSNAVKFTEKGSVRITARRVRS
ncbi:MAG: PAS domain S-box protein [Nitrospira sp.]|nr:PAS domain S-box protein [Nitrospira sp.]